MNIEKYFKIYIQIMKTYTKSLVVDKVILGGILLLVFISTLSTMIIIYLIKNTKKLFYVNSRSHHQHP